MSKLSGDTLREGISSILAASQEKQRKFTETIELQASQLMRSIHGTDVNESRWQSLSVSNSVRCPTTKEITL